MNLVTTAKDMITLGELKEIVLKLPGLPVIIIKIIEAIDDPDSDIQHITALCSQDAVITAQILRVANSPFYGLAGQVKSINEACMVLGTHTLCSIVVAAGFMQRFTSDDENVIDRSELWKHSLNVASISRVLAEKQNLEQNEAFTAGLLHDLGKLAMDEAIPEIYNGINNEVRQNGMPFQVVEKKQLGFDHSDIGALLAHEWKLPSYIVEAIQYHHSTGTGESAVSLLVSVADRIEHAIEENIDIAELYPGKTDGNFVKIFPHKQVLLDCLEECRQIVKQNSGFF